MRTNVNKNSFNKTITFGPLYRTAALINIAPCNKEQKYTDQQLTAMLLTLIVLLLLLKLC